MARDSLTTSSTIAPRFICDLSDLSAEAGQGHGPSCGDDLGPCLAPESACADGWHICGTSGSIGELSGLDVGECHTVPGQFVAAMSHCTNNAATCDYAAILPCFESGFCSEPVCCGVGCYASPGCPSGVWLNATWIHANNGDGCNSFAAGTSTGVLCCVN